jgi:hypothetical protein
MSATVYVAPSPSRPSAPIAKSSTSCLRSTSPGSSGRKDADGLICPRPDNEMRILRDYLAVRGWRWTPTMKIGSGCTVHLRADELPTGRLIVRVSGHLVAVIDGVILDTHNCSRDGMRCVYGYFARGAP